MGYALHFAPDELGADREIVLAAVQIDGFALEYASNGLKADREIVLEAINASGLKVLEYVPKEIKEQIENEIKDFHSMRLVSRGFKEDIQTHSGIHYEEPEEKECKAEDESAGSQQTSSVFRNNEQFPPELTKYIASFLCPDLDQVNIFTKDRETMEQSIEAAS